MDVEVSSSAGDGGDGETAAGDLAADSEVAETLGGGLKRSCSAPSVNQLVEQQGQEERN